MAIDAGRVAAVLSLDTSNFAEGIKSGQAMVTAMKNGSLSASEKIKALGTSMTSVGKTLTVTASAGIAALGALAAKTFAGFEDSMLLVKATMNASNDDYQAMTEAAKEAGATTRYTASQAANALNYLALAGYDANEAISAMPSVLRLAQAGGIDLAYASDMVTDSMSALGIGMEDLDLFIDQMARTSQTSNTNIAQLGEAILTVGGTARQLKGGTVELNTVLGILADNGIKGAEGGTHLRNMLLSLSSPTDVARRALSRIGLDVYDASGNLRGLDEVFFDLKESLSGMSQAEQNNIINAIFNRTDLASVTALLGNCTDRYQELSGEIAASEGASQSMADTMESGLAGSIRNLLSAAEGLAIEFGENLAPTVKGVTEWVTNLTRGFAALDEGTQTAIVRAAAIAAAVGPVLIIAGKLVSAVTLLANPVVAVTAGIGLLTAGIIALVHEARRNDPARIFASWRSGIETDQEIEASITAAIDTTGVEVNAQTAHEEILTAMRGMGLTDEEITQVEEAAKHSAEELARVLTGLGITDDAARMIGDAYDDIARSLGGRMGSLYGDLEENLMDDLPNTWQTTKALTENTKTMYETARAELDAWYQSEKEKLAGQGLSDDDYAQRLLELETQYETYSGTLTECETATVAWIRSMAGKSSEYVAAHLSELTELQDKVNQVTDDIDRANEALTGQGELGREMVKSGATTDKETIASAVGSAYAGYTQDLAAIEDKARSDRDAADIAYSRGFMTKEEHLARESTIISDADAARESAKAAYADEINAMLQGITDAFAATDPDTAAWTEKMIELVNMPQVLDDLIAGLQNGTIDTTAAVSAVQSIYDSVFGAGEYTVTPDSVGMMAQEIKSQIPYALSSAFADDTMQGNPYFTMMETLFQSDALEGLSIDTSTPEAWIEAAMGDVGRAGVQGMTGALTDGEVEMNDATRGFAKISVLAARNELGVHSPSRVFYGIGQAMVDGLIQGAGSRENSLASAMRRIAIRAAQAARQELGIHSPSQVFREMGQYVSRGFALGIDDEAAGAADAMLRMTSPEGSRPVQSYTDAPAYNITLSGARITSEEEARDVLIKATQYTRRVQRGYGA